MESLHVQKPLWVSAVSAVIIALQRILRNDRELMHRLSRSFVRPVHQFLSRLTGRVSFSVAEILILLAGGSFCVWLVVSIVRLLRKDGKRKQLVHIALTLLSAFLSIYAGFCLLWGVYYYGEDFGENTGITARAVSTEELEEVTSFFTDLANSYAGLVPRDTDGVYAGDRADILRRSATLYRNVETMLPVLHGPEVPVKPFFFSRLLSLTDFTGFFFPFTGEANVNIDFPPSLLPATVAHEIAHQRGVAREQEANFCAVLASLESGDPEYGYSACLMAWTYLGNALYSADRESWERQRDLLDERILRDFAANQMYWQRFETPVQNISNTVYEGFLQSYDQELGLKSYGACVDLLVGWYLESAHAS